MGDALLFICSILHLQVCPVLLLLLSSCLLLQQHLHLFYQNPTSYSHGGSAPYTASRLRWSTEPIMIYSLPAADWRHWARINTLRQLLTNEIEKMGNQQMDFFSIFYLMDSPKAQWFLGGCLDKAFTIQKQPLVSLKLWMTQQFISCIWFLCLTSFSSTFLISWDWMTQ